MDDHKPEKIKQVLLKLIKERGLDDVLNEISAHYAMYDDLVKDFKEMNDRFKEEERKEKLTLAERGFSSGDIPSCDLQHGG